MRLLNNWDFEDFMVNNFIDKFENFQIEKSQSLKPHVFSGFAFNIVE